MGSVCASREEGPQEELRQYETYTSLWQEVIARLSDDGAFGNECTRVYREECARCCVQQLTKQQWREMTTAFVGRVSCGDQRTKERIYRAVEGSYPGPGERIISEETFREFTRLAMTIAERDLRERISKMQEKHGGAPPGLTPRQAVGLGTLQPGRQVPDAAEPSPVLRWVSGEAFAPGRSEPLAPPPEMYQQRLHVPKSAQRLQEMQRQQAQQEEHLQKLLRQQQQEMQQQAHQQTEDVMQQQKMQQQLEYQQQQWQQVQQNLSQVQQQQREDNLQSQQNHERWRSTHHVSFGNLDQSLLPVQQPEQVAPAQTQLDHLQPHWEQPQQHMPTLQPGQTLDQDWQARQLQARQVPHLGATDIEQTLQEGSMQGSYGDQDSPDQVSCVVLDPLDGSCGGTDGRGRSGIDPTRDFGELKPPALGGTPVASPIANSEMPPLAAWPQPSPSIEEMKSRILCGNLRVSVFNKNLEVEVKRLALNPNTRRISILRGDGLCEDSWETDHLQCIVRGIANTILAEPPPPERSVAFRFKFKEFDAEDRFLCVVFDSAEEALLATEAFGQLCSVPVQAAPAA
mmetsp:Transcript_85458/g.189821  ORF Transcript_85458/g.189821 Transcript_85458/m.189821 type:complete len:571 (+) Transcript_85458:1-1713(+)